MPYTQDETDNLFGQAVFGGWTPKQIYQGAKSAGIDNDALASSWNVWNKKQGVDSAITGQQVGDYALQAGFDTSKPATAEGYSQAQANQLFSDAVQSGWQPQDIYQGATKLGINPDQLATAWNAYNRQVGNQNPDISGQQVYNYSSQKGYTPQTYEQNIGNSFTGMGSTATTAYKFLPQSIRDQIKNQGQYNKYAYLDADGTQSFTVSELLGQRKADPNAIAINNSAYERQERRGEGGPLQYINPDEDLYLWTPGGTTYRTGREGREITVQPQYISKSEFLQRIGTENENARIAFAGEKTGMSPTLTAIGGKNQMMNDPSLATVGTRLNSMALGANVDLGGNLTSSPYTFVDASTDPNLKGFVQLGDGGELYDDIPGALDKVYELAGVKDDPQKKEMIDKTLFRYDPRFGVLMDDRILDLVMAEKEKNTSDGFFFDNLQNIAMAAFTVLTAGVGAPIIGAIAAGMNTAAQGGGFKDIAKSVITSYVGANMAPLATGIAKDLLTTAGALNPTSLAITSGAIQGAGSGLLSQLATTGKVDFGTLAAQTAAGGIGGGVAKTVTGALGGVVNDRLASGVGKVAGTVVGNAITGKDTDPVSTGMGLIPGLARGAANLYQSSTGTNWS